MRSPRSATVANATALVLLLLAVLTASACARSVDDGTDLNPPLFSDGGDLGPTDYCIQKDCPPPLATCPGRDGLCTTDTSRDVDNCGGCGAACPAQPPAHHATGLCTGGTCAYACDELFADCNKDAADGCEVYVGDDDRNCGGCGIACEPGVACWRGGCGCPSGLTLCGDDCKNLQSDMLNCGACDKLCLPPTSSSDPRWECGPDNQPPNTTWSCASAKCSIECKPPFGDCNDDMCGDGCEVDKSSDPKNCGACGHACAANQDCVDGSCLCPEGTTRCGDSCVDILNDPSNCGGCLNDCPGPSRSPGGGPQCSGGVCTYVCYVGYADCNGRIYDGCETNIGSDPLHCGSCTTKCDTRNGQPCVGGTCLTKPCPPPPPVN
ncbi:MAG: Tryptophan synthase alpha chain [Labilithrix sp.]|nr:Tryptophan synthase alpha chain [Labilithrix sp.]